MSSGRLAARAIWCACVVVFVIIAVATPRHNHSAAAFLSLIAMGAYVVGFVLAFAGAIADLVAIIRGRVHSAITPLFLAGELAYLAIPAYLIYREGYPTTRTVDVTVTAAAGDGRAVTSDPPGISCTSPYAPTGLCRAQFSKESRVTLRANGAGTWGADCAHAGSDKSCILAASGDVTVTFRFDADQRP
jgi:hypothetical protein